MAAENPKPPAGAAFDFNQLLSYDPATGVLTARGSRVVIAGTSQFGSLRKSLLAVLPWDKVKEISTRAGRDQGFHDALAVAQSMQVTDDLDFVKIGAALVAPNGRARMDLEKVEFQIMEGRLSVRARFQSSQEAVDHLRTMGPSKEGVCWTVAGYAQGFVEALFDQPIYVVEYECLAMGNGQCRLLVTSSAAEAEAAVAAAAGVAAPTAALGAADPSAISYEHIVRDAQNIAPAEHERLSEFYARKDAELERSRVKYRALIDASPDVVLEVGHDGRILVANEALRPLTGASPSEAVGMPLADLFEPADRPEVERFIEAFRGDPLAIFPRLHARDHLGSRRTIEFIMKAIPTSGARETSIVELRDITTRARLEEEIWEREARLRALVEAAADGMLVWGESGAVEEANPAAEQILGYPPGGLKGVAIESVVHSTKGTAGAAKGTVPARLRGLKGVDLLRRWVGDAVLVRRGGETTPAILSVTPIKVEGEGTMHLALIKDLREVESLREALATERVKTDAIVEAIAEPMVIFDARGAIEWRNVHAEFVFGRRRLVQGSPCHLTLCENAEPCETCPVASFTSAVQNPGTIHHERSLRTTDGGAHPFELTFRRLTEHGRPARTLVLFRDVSEEAGRELAARERSKRDDLTLEVSAILLSARALPDMMAKFADRVAASLKLTTLAVLLKAGDDWLHPVAVFHGGSAVKNLPPKIPAGNTGVKEVVAEGEVALISDADKSAGASSLLAVIERPGAPPSGSLAAAPLRGRAGTVLGALVVGRAEVDAFEDADVRQIEEIAGRLGLALDGVLLAEASHRVLKLQEALLAEAEIMLDASDLPRNTRRFIEILAEATGAPAAALVHADRAGGRYQVFALYTAEGGHAAGPFASADPRDCPVVDKASRTNELQLIEARSLLRSERNDAVLRQVLGERTESVVIMPVEAGEMSGLIVLALPASFRITTEAEVEVLRTLATQTRLAVGALVAAGKAPDIWALLGGQKAGSA